DVVGEGPEEIALDRRERPASEAECICGSAQVTRHERDVTGLDRDVGAGTHGEAELGLRKRRCVVDAVTDHCDTVPLCLQTLDRSGLRARIDLGNDALDPDLCSDALGGRTRIARQQHGCEPKGLQLADRLRARRLYAVAEAERRTRDAVPPDLDRVPATR